MTMNITYRQEGDYLIPNISMKTQGADQIEKYGRMRQKFLLEEREVEYSIMFMKGTLIPHILEVQSKAETMLDQLIEEMKVSENITEELKMENQLLWVQKMNNIKQRAEEIVIKEIICI